MSIPHDPYAITFLVFYVVVVATAIGFGAVCAVEALRGRGCHKGE